MFFINELTLPGSYNFRAVIKSSQTIMNSLINSSIHPDLEIAAMRDSAQEVVGILKLIANTDRLLILCHLSQAELNVSEIEHMTEIRQPTLSQQLMILRKNNVVTTRRDGKQIYYSIGDQTLVQLLNQLYQLYCVKN
jgi:ArsR family transcriptional regulator